MNRKHTLITIRCRKLKYYLPMFEAICEVETIQLTLRLTYWTIVPQTDLARVTVLF